MKKSQHSEDRCRKTGSRELEANLASIVKLLKKKINKKDPVSNHLSVETTYQWRSIHLTMYRARFGL